MGTTFAVSFKNKALDTLTGRANSNYVLYYTCFYAGSLVADPTTTVTTNPTGYSSGAIINGYMSQSAGGVSAMSVPRSTPAGSTTAGVMGCARFFDGQGTPLIDTTISLAGGGGGVIVPTLTASASMAFQMNQFSLKLPNNLGTVYLNDALRDALINALCVTAANVAALSSATINVYTGTPPTSANAPATGTLLWTATTAASGASWNSAGGGAANLVSSIAAAAIAGVGATATYARIVKGSYVLQGTVGVTGADFLFDSVTMTSGQTYSLSNCTLVI